MPINTETLNRKLFKVLSRYKPKPLDSSGEETDVEDTADVFKFVFTKDGEPYGLVYATIDNNRELKVYHGNDVSDSPSSPTPGVDYNDTWEGLLEFLKSWAMNNQLSWDPDNNKDHLVRDMGRRKHMKKKENVAEGYYPMGKRASYSDAIPNVKIVIEHSKVMEEGEQRYRAINRIFLENQDGERFLLQTKKPGVARVYARHIAEGGKVNDERWAHVNSLCEEYSRMAGFVRATRNGQFNESAQVLVNEGISHYYALRETLSRMTGQRGYNAYFESWTPSLMEAEDDEQSLNELFVQETLDPRIESVMPILSRLHKQVAEMKEVNALAEWADQLVEGGDGGEASEEIDGDTSGTAGEGGAEDAPEDDLLEAPGAETLKHNQDTEEDNLKAFGLAEEESLTSNNPVGIPEEVDMGQYDAVKSGSKGKDEDDDVFKRFREKIRQYGDELEHRQKEKEVDEGLDADQKRVGQLGPTEKVKNNNIGKLVGANENFINTDAQAVVTEEEGRPYVCVHAKKGECSVSANSSYEAAQKAAKKWGLKGTAGIDAHVADKPKDAASLGESKEGQEDLDAILRIIRK